MPSTASQRPAPKGAAKRAAGKKAAQPKAAAAAAAAPRPWARESVLEMFRLLDLNGDGTIDAGELGSVLRTLNPEAWTEQSVRRLLGHMDLDLDGRVDVEEFLSWILDEDGGGPRSFKGALELAGTTAGGTAVRVLASDAAAVAAGQKPGPIAAELALLRSKEDTTCAALAAEVKGLAHHDLLVLSQLPVAPEAARRTLELVCLLLRPSRGQGVDDVTPPAWREVQQLIGDHSIMQRILSVDKRRAEMRGLTLFTSYMADVYFGAASDGCLRAAPLRHANVIQASQAVFGLTEGKTSVLVSLYKWCLFLLEPELTQLASAEEHV